MIHFACMTGPQGWKLISAYFFVYILSVTQHPWTRKSNKGIYTLIPSWGVQKKEITDSIYLQNSALIQPRTSPDKFAV